MRIYPNQDPTPAGMNGTQANVNQCIANFGAAGATAGPRSVNPLGQMVPYGSSLASTSRQGGSNLGGQNRTPGGFPTSGSFFAASLSSAFCPCNTNFGGTLAQGMGKSTDGMSACELNSAICQSTRKPPNPRPNTCSI